MSQGSEIVPKFRNCAKGQHVIAEFELHMSTSAAYFAKSARL